MIKIKKWKLIVIATLFFSITICATPGSVQASALTSANVIALINQSRAAEGLSALTTSTRLNQAAQNKANDMFAQQYFEHTGPDGRDMTDWVEEQGYDWYAIGENISYGYDTAESVHTAFMNSSGHRANILGADYKDVGVAAVSGNFEGQMTYMVVEEFGATDTAEQTKFVLTVNSGSGSGSYASGTQVTITAAAAPTGKVFDKWTGSTTYIASATSATTTVTMPSSAITLTATYKTAPVTTYTLIISGGSGSGSYASGTSVTITAAAAPTGKVFDKWTGSTSYLASTTSATTTVTMPSSAITLTATYKTAPVAKSSAKSITAFTLKGVAGTINETSRTISVNLPTGTSLTSIAPTITVSAKATVSPTSGTSKNFASPVIYTVTAEDGSTQSYVITATVAGAAQSSAKAITAFILGGKTGVINENDHSITVSLPSGTNVTSLTPDIYLSVKSTVSPGSGAAKNYTNPVNYIVTAENGSIQAYVVTVTVGSSSTNSTSPIGTITYSIKTSTSGNVIATLVPSETVTVTSTGGFTHTFTQNGIFTFTFTDADGNTGTAIATVNNIDKTTPTITLNGNSTINLTTGTTYNELGAIATDNIDGSVGVVTSGSVNINTAGTYIITYTATDTAGNVATTTRTVKVTGTDTTTSENAMLSFAFKTFSPDVFGVIDEVNHKVTLTVPFSTNLTALVPTIRVSDGATVSPTSETAQNFTTAKTYTVTSSTGTKQIYTVTVKKATINLPIGIIDGDIIQCKTSANPFAVYIVKIVGDKIYIRHIVSLQIFNYYKHLKWENLKQVNSLEPYSLSGWVRVNTGVNGRPGANDKVYEVNGDQTKHWINMTAQQFLTHGGSDEAIYTVNQGELNLYKTGVDVMSL